MMMMSPLPAVKEGINVYKLHYVCWERWAGGEVRV